MYKTMSIIGLVLGIIEHSIIGALKSIMCVSLVPLYNTITIIMPWL